MRAKNLNENLPTRERLELALAAIDEPLRTELFNFFWLANPIEMAAKLLSLELPVDTTREILLTKVSMPPRYKGAAIEVLVDRAIGEFWNRMSEERKGDADVATA